MTICLRQWQIFFLFEISYSKYISKKLKLSEESASQVTAKCTSRNLRYRQSRITRNCHNCHGYFGQDSKKKDKYQLLLFTHNHFLLKTQQPDQNLVLVQRNHILLQCLNHELSIYSHVI